MMTSMGLIPRVAFVLQITSVVPKLGSSTVWQLSPRVGVSGSISLKFHFTTYYLLDLERVP